MYKHVIKRLIDLILSSVAIIVLALPMLIIAIAIKIDDPGPVLFKQKRVGKKKNGKITYFMIWKFRSMKMSTPTIFPVPTVAARAVHRDWNWEMEASLVWAVIRFSPKICPMVWLIQ